MARSLTLHTKLCCEENNQHNLHDYRPEKILGNFICVTKILYNLYMGQTQTKLMRERLWQKMYEAKLRDNYLCQLIAIKRNWLQRWNIFILVVSTSGIMGWKFWDLYPAIACAIVSIVSLLKLIEQHIIPSEKQIEKIDELVDFYCDFYSQLEKIWYAFDKDMITEEEMVAKLHDIEQKERSINKTANEIGKKNNVRCFNKAKQNTDIFFQALLK